MKIGKLIAALTAAAFIAVPLQAGTLYAYSAVNESNGIIIDSYVHEDAEKAKAAAEEEILAVEKAPDNVLKNMEYTGSALNVTPEMCTPEYWHNKVNCSDSVIMSEKKIAAFNKKILKTPETNTNDLSSYDGTYNGVYLAELNAGFDSPAGLYLNGESVPEEYYEAIRENIRNAPVTEEMPYKFGFAVNRTVMKAYPYEDYLSDDPNNPEWDDLVSSAILVNEPLVIMFTTADGKFTMVHSQCC